MIASARRLFVFLLAGYGALSAFLIWRSAVLRPYSDMLDWLDRYYRFQTDHDLARYLLTPHNLHRLVWTLGALALDARMFGASSYFLVLVGVASLGLATAVLAREAAAGAPAGLGLPAAGFAAMATLMAGNLLDASIPINTTYAHCLAFSVLAISLAEPRQGEPLASSRLAASLACAIAAALGNAVGLALWPVLVFMAWRQGARAATIAAIAGVGALFTLAYMWGQDGSAGGSSSGLGDAAVFGLSFLGLPWTRVSPKLGLTIGAGMLALAAAAVVRRGGPGAARGERVACGFILFSLGATLMAVLGRSGSGPASDVPLRYALLLAPLHVGLLILGLPVLAAWRARRPAAVDGAIVAAGLLALGHQAIMGMAAVKTTDVNRAMISAFNAGVRTPAMAGVIHPNLAHAEAISARLRHDGIYQHEWRSESAR